jgi:hypothetical protein
MYITTRNKYEKTIALYYVCETFLNLYWTKVCGAEAEDCVNRLYGNSNKRMWNHEGSFRSHRVVEGRGANVKAHKAEVMSFLLL